MEDKLRKLQLTQLEILKAFDSFCRKHSLKYSLYAGSLLGAVRHKAFIPWDDDLDVCMTRSEYNRFIELWMSESPEGYILVNKDNAKYFDQSFSKICKDHTTFMQDEWRIGCHHTGIFMDIFPIDRIPNGKLKRMVYKWNGMVYQLMNREFVPSQGNAFVKLGSAVLLRLITGERRKNVRRYCLTKLVKYNDNPDLEMVAIETMASIRKPLAANLMDHYIQLPFEDGIFMCFAEWHDYLRREYGDYMQLPPEDSRAWRHHPSIIDFEHNFEELENR